MFSTRFLCRLAIATFGVAALTTPLNADDGCVLVTPGETYLIRCPAQGSTCRVTASDGTSWLISRAQAWSLC